MTAPQKTRRIEHFFKVVSSSSQPTSSSFRIFFLDWSQKPYRAVWLSDQHNEPTVIPDFECEVVWKELGKVILVQGVLPSGSNDDADKGEDPPHLYQDKSLISLLKSNLQKCIRRQLTRRAVETARYLGELDFTLLVRRLAIIMLEDVVLHESFSVLVWLTAALSKGFQASLVIKEWLLGLVHYLCRQPDEQYWSCAIDNGRRDIEASTIMAKHKEMLEHPHRDMAFSLLFRMSYGGLAGDISMLFSFIERVLQQRQQDKTRVYTDIIAPIKWDETARIDLGLVEPSSADFHCAPQILFALTRQYKQYHQQTLKQTIWHHSSKYNSRVVYPRSEIDKKDELRPCFLVIARRLLSLQQEHIRVCRNLVGNAQFKLEYGGQYGVQ
jgi:hypothetical protein